MIRLTPRSCSLPLAVVLTALALTLPLARQAAADPELDGLKRQAQELIDRLQQELEALRAERELLEVERKGLKQQGLEAPAPLKTADTDQDTQRKVQILGEEIARLKERIVLPDVKEYKSYYGLGPAASKIYQTNRGLSIGGYGEANLSQKVSDRSDGHDEADFLRFVLYTGYKFTDRLLLNAELELEHATTESTVTASDGSFSLEFGYLDYLYAEGFNARAGLVLVPLGFLNEIHEPVFFFGNNRPEVERTIIPTTWRALGAGVFGSFADDVQYRAYLTTSLNAKGFGSSGIRGGRQKGNRARAEDAAGSVRLDYTPHQVPGFLVGASGFFGNTGQNQRFAGKKVDAFLTLWDVHAQYRYRGIELRALAAFGSLDGVEALSKDSGESVADRFEGWYAEVGYDVMPHLFPQKTTQYLAPFFRYESIDPQESVGRGFVRDLTEVAELYTVGVSYKPHPQVVFKLDYRNFVARRGSRPDDINIGLGFIF